MATLDFPDNPTNGQVYDKWTWNGTAWVLTPPVAPTVITAGAGLVQNGSAFNVVAADGTIVVGADSISVGVVPNSKLSNAAAYTVKGNYTNMVVPPVDMSIAQTNELLGIPDGLINWGGYGDAVGESYKLLIQSVYTSFTTDYYGNFTIYFPQQFASGTQVTVHGILQNWNHPGIIQFTGPTLTYCTGLAYMMDGTPWRNLPSNIQYTAFGRRA